MKKLGEKIVCLRQRKAMTQVELAHVSNMESSSLRKIERGKINPTIWTLRRLCVTLEIPLAELFEFELDEPI